MARDPWTPHPPDLPRAPQPADLTDELLDGVLLRGTATQVPPDVRVLGAVLEEVRLVAADVERWAVADVLVARPDLAGVRLPGLQLRRARVDGGRLSGTVASGAVVEDVVLDGVHAPGMTLRGTTLRRVRATGCDLSDLDLGGATLDHVVLDGCDLTGLHLHGATVVAARLTGCTLEGVQDADRLRGASVDLHGLLQLLPSLAAAAGITLLP